MDTNKEYDFKAPIEKTSVALARVVLDKLSENFNTFIYEDIDRTDEQKAEFDEKATDFGINLISLMASTDIPADYATYGIDKLIVALSAAKNYIDGTVRQMHDEVLSRTLGAKSPVTNTFARDCATLGQVYLAVNKARETTDGEYFVTKED